MQRKYVIAGGKPAAMSASEFVRQLEAVALSLSTLHGYEVIISVAQKELLRSDVERLEWPFALDAIVEVYRKTPGPPDSVFAILEQQLFDVYQSGFWAAVEEQVAVCAPSRTATPVKLFSFLVRRPDDAVDQFETSWVDGHGGMAPGVPAVRGFAMNLIRQSGTFGDWGSSSFSLNGIAITRFASLKEREVSLGQPEAIRWRADGASFIGRILTLVTAEADLQAVETN